MVDILALAVSHGLLALAAWRLLLRADLDVETPRDGAPPESEPARRLKAVRREMRWPGGKREPEGGGDA